jgi:periplasmic copper chaperone A
MLPFCQVEHDGLEHEPGEMTMRSYGSPRQSVLFVMAAFVLCLALCPAIALAASTLRVESPWARASLNGVRNAIVYGSLVNEGSAPLTIVGGSTPVAARVEFHIHAMNGDVMTMKQLDRIALKPGERATLQPGGLHIMLINLKQPLKQGASFPLTLVASDGTSVDITVKIESATATGPTQ